jgi:uncharacterized protein YicC (UPF0701 family)
MQLNRLPEDIEYLNHQSRLLLTRALSCGRIGARRDLDPRTRLTNALIDEAVASAGASLWLSISDASGCQFAKVG